MESHVTKSANDDANDAVIPSSSIDIENLSYKGSDGWLAQTNLTTEQTNAIIYYLCTKYHAVEIGIALPFIEVVCRGGPPAEDNRPPTIADAIAVWRSEDDGMFSPIFGEFAWGDEIDIDKIIVSMIKSRAPLPQQAIDFFAFELVPDCIGLAVIYNTLVIELPETDFETSTAVSQRLLTEFAAFPCFCTTTMVLCPIPSTRSTRARPETSDS